MAVASAEGSTRDFFLRGIVSGWLIALMVWMLPAAQASRLTIIVAIDVFFLAFMRVHSTGAAFGYIGPTLVGDVLGGVALTAG